MSLYQAFDASIPPMNPYPGCKAVMGYVGGNTPHVWTLAEWERFSNLAQFPIWVGYHEDHPEQHANACVSAVKNLGWAAHHVPRRAVLLDFETEINPSWIDSFAGVIWEGGYETMIYGSESTIVQNPPKEGRWIALYNGQMSIPSDPYAVGHQYKANVPWDGTVVDLSVITDQMMAHAGYGPRR
jgi:hypothetical protein